MNAERNEKCEMLKSELSQLALVLESNQVFAEPINPITGEYLIRLVGHISKLDSPTAKLRPVQLTDETLQGFLVKLLCPGLLRQVALRLVIQYWR